MFNKISQASLYHVFTEKKIALSKQPVHKYFKIVFILNKKTHKRSQIEKSQDWFKSWLALQRDKLNNDELSSSQR